MMNKILFISLMIIQLTSVMFAQNKTTIAVLNFEGKGVSQTNANSITDRIRHEIFQTGEYRVLEREMMEEILAEQGFQLSGCTSSECAVEAGRLLGVQRMVAGSVNKLGNLFTLFLRMIDVENGEILASASVDCQCEIEEVALKSTPVAVIKLMTASSKQTSKESETPQYEKREKSSSEFDAKPSLEKELQTSKNKNIRVTLKIGGSHFTGFAGLEIQIKKISFNFGVFPVGDFIAYYNGIKYYFKPDKTTYFIGLGCPIFQDRDTGNPDRQIYHPGMVIGHCWRWGRRWNLNFGLGATVVNEVSHYENMEDFKKNSILANR